MNHTDFVPVDFSNADEDGAVRLVTKGTAEYLESYEVELVQGRVIVMTDGELIAKGECEQRDGIWVARITKWIT